MQATFATLGFEVNFGLIQLIRKQSRKVCERVVTGSSGRNAQLLDKKKSELPQVFISQTHTFLIKLILLLASYFGLLGKRKQFLSHMKH